MPQSPNRYVEKNVLFSNHAPAIRIKIADDFTFVGQSSFELGGRSTVEVFFFAQTNQDIVERFVQFQFEARLDHIRDPYNYDELTETEMLGDVEYLMGYWCFSMANFTQNYPQSDVAKVQHLLNQNGLRSPEHYAGMRFVQLLGEDKRSELLIVAGESTTITNLDCQSEAAFLKHREAVRTRVLASFTVDVE